MRLRDFLNFWKKKPLMIEGGKTISERGINYQTTIKPRDMNQSEKGVEIQIFGCKNFDNEMEYDYRMQFDGKTINVASVKGGEGVSLKGIKRELEYAVERVITSRNPYSLEKNRQETAAHLQEMCKTTSGLSLNEEVIELISKYQQRDMLDYDIIEGLKRKIDPSAITQEEAKDLQKQLQQRLNDLKTIKTPDDAYKEKENLSYFMQQQEDAPQSALIDANIQSLEEGIPLDEATIAKIAHMETLNLNNEDGALYSVYLKLEEKRIWDKMRETLEQYYSDSQNQGATDDSKYQVSILMEELGTFELQHSGDGFSYEILDYMISGIKENDIEKYNQNVKEKDVKLAKIINTQADIPYKKQMLAFLYARIGSLGQLSYKSQLCNHGVLREFVANTDFKDSNNTASKEFLLLVSKIERDYVEKQYREISEIYPKKHSEEKDFKQGLDVGYTPTVDNKQTKAFGEQVQQNDTISNSGSIGNR